MLKISTKQLLQDRQMQYTHQEDQRINYPKYSIKNLKKEKNFLKNL